MIASFHRHSQDGRKPPGDRSAHTNAVTSCGSSHLAPIHEVSVIPAHVAQCRTCGARRPEIAAVVPALRLGRLTATGRASHAGLPARLRRLFPAAVLVHFTAAAAAPPLRPRLCLANRPLSLGWMNSWLRSEISGVEAVFAARSCIADLLRCACTDGSANQRGRVVSGDLNAPTQSLLPCSQLVTVQNAYRQRCARGCNVVVKVQYARRQDQPLPSRL